MAQRILIIDAHPVYGDKLISHLPVDEYIVEQLKDPQEAVSVILKTQPDQVILSANIPTGSALVLLEDIVSNFPTLKIIIQCGLLTKPEENQAFLQCGARHVVLRKEKDQTALLAALH